MLDGSEMSNDIWDDMAVLFISIGQMPFPAPTLDHADPHFALWIYNRFLSAPRRGGGGKTQLVGV